MNSNRFRLLAFIALFIVVAAAVILVLWSKPPVAPGPYSSAAAVPLPTPFPPSVTTDFHGLLAHATPSPSPRGEEIPAWERRIDQVLRSQANETQAALILLNLLPTLPEEGQVEAASHIVNLLPDEAYAQIRPVVLNPGLPEPVLSVFFSDLMNRSDAVKLQMFLDVGRVSNHPFHEEALTDLQIYLGEDYGDDWAKWQSALNQYLKNAAPQ